MEKRKTESCQKIPIHLLDGLNIKDKLEKSIMEIFHFNQIKLVQLQEELNSCSEPKTKEIVLKVYNIFQDLSHIFTRLGIQDLYHQVRLIVNAISKVMLMNQPKQKLKDKEKVRQAKAMEKKITIQQEITKEPINKGQFQVKGEGSSEKSSKPNKLGGIFLYNESYSKHVERNLDLQRQKNKKINFRDLEDPLDNIQELERQEMCYYIERKKQLSVLKIKDHSKSYQQIENQFRMVEERLKQVLQNLQIQLDHENIKQFQYLSKEQISKELLSFNSTMRSQLVVLKEQYNNANDNLREQNIELRSKLNQMIALKNSMIHTQTQTVETISSIKKVKKLAEEYEVKVKLLEKKIEEGRKKEIQMESRYKSLEICKEKQIALLQKSISKKEQELIAFKDKCEVYEITINEMQEKITSANNAINATQSEKPTHSATPSLDRINFAPDEFFGIEKMRAKKSFINRLSMNKNSFKSISRYSNSSFSKTDGAKFTSFLQHHNSEGMRREDGSENAHLKVLKKNFPSRWSKKNNDEQEGNFQGMDKISRSVARQKSLMHYIGEADGEEIGSNAQIQTLKNMEMKSGSCNLIEKKGDGASLEKEVEYRNRQIKLESQKRQRGIEKKREQLRRRRISKKGRTRSVIHEEVQLKNKLTSNKQNLAIQKANPYEIPPKSLNRVINTRKIDEVTDKSKRSKVTNRKMDPIAQFKREMAENISGNHHRNGPEAMNKVSDIKKALGKELNGNESKIRESNTNTDSNTESKSAFSNKQISKIAEKFNSKSPQLAKNKRKQPFFKLKAFKEQKQPQVMLPSLTHDQILLITDKILQQGTINDLLLDKISLEYPEFLPAMKTFEFSQKLFEQLNKTHQKKCTQKPCRHLQVFVQFCSRFKEGINSNNRRTPLKLHVQDFCNV